MDERIKTIITQWGEEDRAYSFEVRLHYNVGTHQTLDDPSCTPVDFIIEVSGFYYDKDQTKPIKLHYERIISIKNDAIVTQQYIDDFHRDLNHLTTTAYANFEKTLNSCSTPIYTNDKKYLSRLKSD